MIPAHAGRVKSHGAVPRPKPGGDRLRDLQSGTAVVGHFDVEAALCRHRARSTRRYPRQVDPPPEPRSPYNRGRSVLR